MARTVVSRFEGTEEVINNLKEVERRIVNRGLQAAYMHGAELVRADAQRRAPRGRTRRLSRDMVAEWQSRRRRAVVGPHKDAYYGFFQEFGTSRNAAQPFLRPALDAKSREVFDAINRELGKVLEERL